MAARQAPPQELLSFPCVLTQEMAHRAAELIRPYLAPTLLARSEALSRIAGRPVLLKCESRQVTGSFKVRGALARLLQIEAGDRPRGVVAPSAGNHALGVAWACRQLGIPGLVVLPETASRIKLQALQELLVKVRLHGRCYDEAEARARELAREAEATFVSPFDDPWVMAGNGGTVGLEITQELGELSAVVVPVGGGGLAAGLATALPGVPVVGVNCDASPAMARSLAEGRVHATFRPLAPTIADGLEGGVSARTVALCGRLLHGVEVVSEESLHEAIRLAARQESMVLEGAAAAAVALLLEGRPLPGGSGPVCLVLTGRNIEKELLRRILRPCYTQTH